jgi:hypothetical protein
LNAMYFFIGLKKNHTPYMTKFKVLMLYFLYFMNNSITNQKEKKKKNGA